MTYSEWLQTKGDFWSLVLEIKQVKPNPKDRKMSETLEASVDYWAVNDVLNGDIFSLFDAFDWASSPQGVVYWHDRAYCLVDLTEDDYDFLKSLL